MIANQTVSAHALRDLQSDLETRATLDELFALLENGTRNVGVQIPARNCHHYLLALQADRARVIDMLASAGLDAAATARRAYSAEQYSEKLQRIILDLAEQVEEAKGDKLVRVQFVMAQPGEPADLGVEEGMELALTLMENLRAASR